MRNVNNEKCRLIKKGTKTNGEILEKATER